MNYAIKSFDHDLPNGSEPDDGNDHVVHYDGSIHNAVTPTPAGDPYVPGIYGYDQHLGIDYNLKYQPVLAAAGGIVDYAGWTDPGNHTKGLGLHLILEHNDAYQTYYAHLSTLLYRTGDEIEVSSLNSPDRNRILGISGSTGRVFGNCNVDEEPLCGAHLHFEARYNDPDGVEDWTVVNPYGWIAPESTPDPWGVSGHTSYDLWQIYPAILSGQYPGAVSTPLPTPYLNDSRLNIDDSSELFTVHLQNCWVEQADPEGYYGSYHWAEVNGTPIPIETPDPQSICQVSWDMPDFDGLFAGEYDVFVYIPEFATSLSAAYDVISAGGVAYNQAVVVQAAYPLGTPSPPAFGGSHTAYIGRYQFDMNGGERIVLGNTGIETMTPQEVVADMISLAPANPNHENIYLSTNYDGTIVQATPIAFSNEDVLLYNANLDSWTLVFDGSAFGLAAANLDGLHVLPDGTFLLSFNGSQNIPGIATPVADQDIVQFVPVNGTPTAGTFLPYFWGAEYGLENPGEEIDAIALAPPPDNRLLVSTKGEYDLGQSFVGDGKDLLAIPLTPTPFVTPAWTLYLDGAAVELDVDTENISGVSVMNNGVVYLAPWGNFHGGGMEGGSTDIFFCIPAVSGSFPMTCAYNLFGRYWYGPAHQITGPIDAISLLASSSGSENLLPNGGFEEGFAQWTVILEDPDCANWSVTGEEAYSGQYSAKAELYFFNDCEARIISAYVAVEPNTRYRISAWGKGYGNPTMGTGVDFGVDWDPGTLVTIGVIDVGHTSWTLFSTNGFVCPVAGAAGFSLEFDLQNETANGSPGINSEATFFVDAVTVEAQPGACPIQ